MYKTITAKKQDLINEIKAIEYTSKIDNLGLSDKDERQVELLRAKIQVLNEVVIANGVK